MRILLTAGLALLLAACGEAVQGAPEPDSVVPVAAFEWRVVSQAELERVYREAGMPITEQDRLHGFVGKTSDGRHVIYTLPPRTVDDAITKTLGHEVMHLALGDYHR